MPKDGSIFGRKRFGRGMLGRWRGPSAVASPERIHVTASVRAVVTVEARVR